MNFSEYLRSQRHLLRVFTQYPVAGANMRYDSFVLVHRMDDADPLLLFQPLVPLSMYRAGTCYRPLRAPGMAGGVASKS
jgi:hypothetical protein